MPRHEYLYGQTLPQLEALCNRLEMPRFAAKQIARWLYDKHATTIEAMSDLSARHRALLAETYEVGLTAPEKVSISTDGTKKYLYRTSQNHFIESAYIPDGDRATLCISSQAGCRMGCRFCATGRQGLQHSLSTNEILNQIESLPERERLTNVVFMGMGEPLDNLDSLLPDTVGFIRKLPTELIESFKSTLDEVREADLLLHVVDISHPQFEDQIAVVKQTLQDIGAGDKPVYLVFNKVDAYTYVEKEPDDLTPSTRENRSLEDLKQSWIARANTPCIFISAVEKINIEKLRSDLYGMVREIHSGRYPFNNFLY